MADPTTMDMLMGAGGGGAGTGIVGFALYKILGKNNNNGNSTGISDRLEGKMDQMIENQHDGNLILAKIEGLLSNKS
jgi:hypothetical protein|tara:strand:- start:1441 stop:1671 length:231 start_codon:yes stop_codon:yes gene_type:complete